MNRIITRLVLTGLLGSGVLGCMTGSAAAASSPDFSAGQTITVYTFDWSNESTFSLEFNLNFGNYAYASVPATLVSQTRGSSGGYIDKLQATVPALGSAPGDADVVVSPGSGGALVTRLQPVQPPITSGYGLEFHYAGDTANQAPEVPLAGALPAGFAALAGGFMIWRRKRSLKTL